MENDGLNYWVGYYDLELDGTWNLLDGNMYDAGDSPCTIGCPDNRTTRVVARSLAWQPTNRGVCLIFLAKILNITRRQ